MGKGMELEEDIMTMMKVCIHRAYFYVMLLA